MSPSSRTRSLAGHLRTEFSHRVDVRVEALEDAELEADRFDLAVAASCFHWIDEDAGLEKVATALRPGGFWSMWWTLFGDGQRKDAFMTAIDPLLADVPRSPSAGSGPGRPAFALDVDARMDALSKSGFEALAHELVRWDATWDTGGIRALYSTFSPIQVLDEDSRERLLDEIAAIAERDFGGKVSRTLTTSVYVARNPGRPVDRTISS